MQQLKWPEQSYPLFYKCSICDVKIDTERNYDGAKEWYTPASRYWNVEHKEIYCGADHMFETHIKRYYNEIIQK